MGDIQTRKAILALSIISSIFCSTTLCAEVYTVTRKVKAPDTLMDLTLSPDGKSVGYYNPRTRSIWIDEVRVSPERMDIVHPDPNFGLTISPSGNKVAYIGIGENNLFVWINNKKVSPSFKELPTVGSFNPDGSRVAYGALAENKKCSIWINDKKVSPEFDEAYPPVCGPDGKSLAYVAKDAGKSWVYINEARISPGSIGYYFRSVITE